MTRQSLILSVIAVGVAIVFGSLGVVGYTAIGNRGDARRNHSLAASAHKDATDAKTQVLAVTSENDTKFQSLQASLDAMASEIAAIQATLASAQQSGGLSAAQIQALQSQLTTLQRQFAATTAQLKASPSPTTSRPSPPASPAPSAIPSASPSCLLGSPLLASPLALPSPLGGCL